MRLPNTGAKMMIGRWLKTANWKSSKLEPGATLPIIPITEN
jgi:hypothetical protein